MGREGGEEGGRERRKGRARKMLEREVGKVRREGRKIEVRLGERGGGVS